MLGEVGVSINEWLAPCQPCRCSATLILVSTVRHTSKPPLALLTRPLEGLVSVTP